MEPGFDKEWCDFKTNVLKHVIDGDDLALIGVDLVEDYATELIEPHTLEWHKCCKKAFKFLSRLTDVLNM